MTVPLFGDSTFVMWQYLCGRICDSSFVCLAHQALRMEAAEAGNDGLPVEGATKRESDSDESVDLEVESNASETTVSCRGFVPVACEKCRPMQGCWAFSLALQP